MKWALAAALVLHLSLWLSLRADSSPRYVVAYPEPFVEQASPPLPRAAARPTPAVARETVRPRREAEAMPLARALPESLPSGTPGVSMEAVARMGNPLPEYPEEALERGWEGIVELSLSLDDEGQASDVSVSRSSGYAILDQSAEAAARRWRLVGMKALRVRVPVRFALD